MFSIKNKYLVETIARVGLGLFILFFKIMHLKGVFVFNRVFIFCFLKQLLPGCKDEWKLEVVLTTLLPLHEDTLPPYQHPTLLEQLVVSSLSPSGHS